MHHFKLRFPPSQIVKLADLNVSSMSEKMRIEEQVIEKDIKASVDQKGFLTREHFIIVCKWKSPRPLKSYEKNDAAFVEEISRYALNAEQERSRIELWTILKGVNVRTASVFLHWFHRDRYPIIDFRALWSLSVEDSVYDFDLWWKYTEYCRELADNAKVDMRTLDRALWQYSKENQ